MIKKIGIHFRKGTLSEEWIEYCKEHNIEYKLVNAHRTDIIDQLIDCDLFMWHYNHTSYVDKLAAKNILFALEHSGISVFPNFNSNWHFDDKVAQKYLLESINAPLVPSYVFYNKIEALNWVKNQKFPLIFKLKGGSGARNVRMIKNKRTAENIIKTAFNNGFSNFNRWGNFKERISKYRNGKETIRGVLIGLYRAVSPTAFAKIQGREKGYVYFQDFIPNNNCDIRLIVIGDKAYGMKRMVRKGDFRASGSGEFVYDDIREDIIKIGFEVTERLKLQSVAFDFVIDENDKPLIVELSFGFGLKGSSKCKGYWDKNLNWHECKVTPGKWVLENILESKI